MDMLHWNPEWNAKDYEWPEVGIPDTAAVSAVADQVTAEGGRLDEEAHADRKVTMEFPNGIPSGPKVRKQIDRCECRRRAKITLPIMAKDPLKVCVICDSVQLWPRFTAG